MAEGEAPEEGGEEEKKEIEEFGLKMYYESVRALRQVGARVFLSIGAAILIWIFGELIFLPIAKAMTQQFFGYPVHSIISFIIAVALAIIVFSVFMDIRRLAGSLAGILAYHFGRASGEVDRETYANYRAVLNGIIYVVVVSLVYLLFARYLAEIHPAVPAVLLVLIVVWSIFELWRCCRAIARVIGRYTSKISEELEKQIKE